MSNNPPPSPSLSGSTSNAVKSILKNSTMSTPKKKRGRPVGSISTSKHHKKKGMTYADNPTTSSQSLKTIAQRKLEMQLRDDAYAELARFMQEYARKYKFKTMVGPNRPIEDIRKELKRLREAKSMIVGTERVEDLAIMLFKGLEFLSATPANVFKSDLRGLGAIAYLKIKGLTLENGVTIKGGQEKYAEDVIKDLKIRYPWLTKQPLFVAVIVSIVGLCGEVHARNTGMISERMSSKPTPEELKKYDDL